MKKYLENDNISSKVIKAAYAIIQNNPGISCADVVEKIHREFTLSLNSGSAIMSVFLHADNTPITHKRYGGRLEDLRVVRPLPKILKYSDDLQAFWDSLSPEQRLRLKIIVFKGTR